MVMSLPQLTQTARVGCGVSPVQLTLYCVTRHRCAHPQPPPHHTWCPAAPRGCGSDGPELQTAEKGQKLGKLRLDKVSGAPGCPSPREIRLWGCLPPP